MQYYQQFSLTALNKLTQWKMAKCSCTEDKRRTSKLLSLSTLRLAVPQICTANPQSYMFGLAFTRFIGLTLRTLDLALIGSCF